MSFAAQPLRQVATTFSRRAISTSTVARGGDEAYVHAKHMYNIQAIPGRGIKFGIATLAILAGGFGIPVFAVHYSNEKLKQ